MTVNLNEMIYAKEEYYKCCLEFGIQLKNYLDLIKKYYEGHIILAEEIIILEKISLEKSMDLFQHQLIRIKNREHNLNLGKVGLSKYEEKLEVLRTKRRETHKKCIEVYVSYGITDTDKINELVDSLDYLNLQYCLNNFEITEEKEEEQRQKIKSLFAITSDLSFIESCEQQSIEEIKQMNLRIDNSIKLIMQIIRLKQYYENKFKKTEKSLDQYKKIQSQFQRLEKLLDSKQNILKNKNKSVINKIFKSSEIEELKKSILNLKQSRNLQEQIILFAKNSLEQNTHITLLFYNMYNYMCQTINWLIDDLQQDELRKLLGDLKITIITTDDNYFDEIGEMKKELKNFLVNSIDFIEYCKINELKIEELNFIKTKRYIRQPLVSENN